MNAPGRRTVLYLAGLLSVVALAGASALAFTRSNPARSTSGPRGAGPATTTRALVVRVQKGSEERRLDLQGEARSFASVTLYAKVSGYLSEIRVDRGDKVLEHEVLAVIQSPEIDRQRHAAKADARYKLANARSAAALTGSGAIPRREVEAATTSAEIAAAVLAGFNVQSAYSILRAPFSGTVTARYADPGALVQNAANAQSGALPVVTISHTDRVRVYVYIDQRYARLVRIGDAAEIVVPESGVSIASRVARTNRELDPRTRTMLAEIDVDNRNDVIVPGSFVRVALTVRVRPLLTVPVEALVFRNQRPFVAVVFPKSRIELRPVVIGQLDGALVSIASGLVEGETVALNLGRAVSDGDSIEPVQGSPSGRSASPDARPRPDAAFSPAPRDAGV